MVVTIVVVFYLANKVIEEHNWHVISLVLMPAPSESIHCCILSI